MLFRQIPALRSWCVINVVGCAGLFGGGSAAGTGGAGAVGRKGWTLGKAVEARRQRASNWNSSEVRLRRGCPLRGALLAGRSQMPSAVAPLRHGKEIPLLDQACGLLFKVRLCMSRGLVV